MSPAAHDGLTFAGGGRRRAAESEAQVMGATVLFMSVSVDGFVAGPDVRDDNGLGDGGERLHDWVLTGEGGEVGPPGIVSTGVNGEVAREFMTTGAVLAGRGTFEPAGGWGGDHHDGVPIVVYSRRAPTLDVSGWPLVTYADDVREAYALAREAAGDADVLVHGAVMARLGVAAGLLDELQLHVVPVLLGRGTPLFAADAAPVDLERIRVREGEGGVTHLRYRVVR
jgi:dihydrofolate reductase